MSAPEAPLLPPAAAATISKKQRNKDARKAAKAEKAAAAQRQQQPQPTAASEAEAEEADPFAASYGDVPDEEVQSTAVSGRSWTCVGALSAADVGRPVLLRGAARSVAAHGSRLAFLVLRQGMDTVQCVVHAGGDGSGVGPGTLRFAAALAAESVVEVEGVVAAPRVPVLGATARHVEVRVTRIRCVARPSRSLPFSLDDAAAPEAELEGHGGTGRARVGQDTRLNHRPVDLRTPTNQAIFRILCQVENKFREFLLSSGFVGIHTPKLNAGASEGGASVFELEYNGQPACLAQSPQLHKQMAISGGLGRVFEVGPVFRAENSKTPKHLCEFTGLDAEMEINEHYFEVCDIVDGLFVAIFEHLNENCKRELEEINKQYPFEPLKYLEQTLKLTYE